MARLDIENAHQTTRRGPDTEPCFTHTIPGVTLRWPNGEPVRYLRWNNMLNGMPPAGAGFSLDMAAHMKKFRTGLKPTIQDEYVYTWFGEEGQSLIIAAIVDDLLLGAIGSKHETASDIIKHFIRHMELRWGVKVLPIDGFLNNEVTTSKDGKLMTMTMAKRIAEIAHDYILNKVQEGDFPANPCHPELRLIGREDDEDLQAEDAKSAHSLCAKLIYIVCMVHYSCQYAVYYAARYTSKPTRRYLAALEHVLGYMYNNRYLGLTFGGEHTDLSITATTDAGHAEDGPSTGGYTIEIDSVPLYTNSGQHKAITLSTYLAEQYELSRACATVIAARDYMGEIGNPQLKPSNMFTDSAPAVYAASAAQSDKQGLYMKRRVKFVQWAQRDGYILVIHIPSKSNRADPLTKQQPTPLFKLQEADLMRTMVNVCINGNNIIDQQDMQ